MTQAKDVISPSFRDLNFTISRWLTNQPSVELVAVKEVVSKVIILHFDSEKQWMVFGQRMNI